MFAIGAYECVVMRILVINCGSSSIKYKFFNMPQEKVLSRGLIDKIGEKGSNIENHRMGLLLILEKLNDIQAVGHRVVHGGERFRQPTPIDNNVIREIKECSELAPLHNLANLAGINACRKLLPHLAQVAVFDTAFHQTMPEYAYIYGLPYEFYRRYRIRKYGFHGTSHQHVAYEASRILKKPLKELSLVTCHLGNGCSITAIEKGRSIDTSMGFTPLEGLVMGTRSGDIDPAIIIYLQRKRGLTPTQVDDILNKDSGLKGISGASNDMRKIKELVKRGNKRAKLAEDIFVYRIKKYIGAYMAVLKKTDAIVFTAGIGENQPKLLRKICQGLFFNLVKKPRVLVISTNEELMIARQTYQLICTSKNV